jgi:U3 small nucleolar RNA-associated protein 3
VKGDEVYEDHKEKMREKKALKKEEKREAKRDQLDQVVKMEESITRNISYDILKARGLVRKRKRIDSNSRVKHREKYRKALIKRKSKVSEFKDGPQKKYAGEERGLKSNIVWSTGLS